MNIAKEPSETEDSSFYKGKDYLNVLPTLDRYGITFCNTMISQITKIVNVFRQRSASTKVYQTDHSPLVASVSELETGVRNRSFIWDWTASLELCSCFWIFSIAGCNFCWISTFSTRSFYAWRVGRYMAKKEPMSTINAIRLTP